MKYTFTRCIRILLLIIVAVTAFLTGKAQYVFSTLETGGNYTAVATDRDDNIYTTRWNSTTGLYDVVKFWAINGLTTVLYSGLSNGSAVQVNNPWGIAVNSFGDVYVLNSFGTGNGQILKLYGGYASAVVRSGKYFSAITVDKNDNLLAIEYNSTTSTFDIVRYQYDGDAGTRLYTGIAVPAKGFSYPWGLVTDSQGNIYFTDFLESAAHPGGAVMKLTYPGYAVSTLATGREFTALAVDASNNLYTTEVVRKGRAAVVKYTNTMGTGTILDSSLTVSGIVYPKGLAVNSMGSVYIGDGPASGNGRLFRLINPGVSSIWLNGVSPTNAGVVRFLVNLTTNVSNLPASAFTLTTTGITGASIAGISSGSDGTYVVTINTGTGDGTIRLDVNGAGVTPALSNVPFTSGEVYTIDKTSPVISLVINGGAAVTNSTTVALTETATDANIPMQMRFSADSSNWSAYETFAGSKSYTLATGNGIQKVYMQVKDNAGNVSGTSAVITLDQTAPVVALTSTPPTSTNQSTATFVFGASETVTGFTASLDGGPFTPVTSPYTLSGLADGPHTLTIKATDIAGNTGVTTPFIWSIDQTPPVIQNLTSAAGTYKIGQAITLMANMSEAVITDNAGTEAPYINMTIGSTTRKAVYASGAGTNQWAFTYTVQEGDLDNDGIEILSPIQVAGNKLTDAANNVLDPSFAVAASGINVNGIRPVATLTVPPTSNATTMTVTLGFDVAVTGVDASSLSLSGIAGATVTAVTPDATTSTNTYTITITVPAGSKGTLHIALAADAATAVGQGGNTNAAAAADVDYDNTAPVITSVSVPAGGYYKAGTTLSFTATFDKNITVAAGGLYLPVTIGSTVVHAGYVSGSGTKELTFSYTVVAGDNDDDGIQIGSSLTADAGVLKDSYGNEAATAINGAGATNNVFVNTVIPGVTLSSGSTIVNGVFAVTATFSDAVTGLTLDDFSVVNGTVSNLQTADHIIYTVDVTPAGEGIVKVQLPVDVAENVGGNGNTVSNELQVTVDTTAPVVTGVSVPADGYYHAGEELDFTVNFSEEVVLNVTTEHPYLNVVLQSGTVQAYYTGRSGNNGMNFKYTVQDGDGDEDGIGLMGAVELDNLSVKDKAGNSANVTLAGVPALGGVKVNTVHPTVALSSGVTLVNGAFDVTATFSEAVTGLALSDFTVNNGVVSNLQTSDNVTYTFTITPTVGGNVTVSLPVDVAVNKGDNGNLASNTVTVVADLTAPAVTNVTVPANGYYKSGSVLSFGVSFGEVVNVTGTPHIAIAMGSSTVYADYVSGTGSSTLTFTYTVVNG
ncbi:Ig-like domain-containing protein, partial [Chitinophaga sp.]|uniref:beta strand repeat-containing protein n=1 Tax=Chitinophaga sp. TaxID=1869181 RepID=UPI0031DBB850